MTKIELNPQTSPFPKPIVLVGAMVEGRPNFMTAAWFTRLNIRPNIWGVAVNKKRYTLEGIQKNRTFSINIPSIDLVVKTDYCGIYSGREVDKSEVFDIFYGQHKTAPMIKECPITAECTVYQLVDLPMDFVVLGEVQKIYSEERYMTDGVLDFTKMRPFVFTRPPDKYWALGEYVGDAYSSGEQFKE